jgi:hypothetical protein
MALREDTGEVVGVMPHEEKSLFPPVIASRHYADLADAVHRPGTANPDEVIGARDAVIDDTGNPLNMVDISAAVIAAEKNARRLSKIQ